MSQRVREAACMVPDAIDAQSWPRPWGTVLHLKKRIEKAVGGSGFGRACGRREKEKRKLSSALRNEPPWPDEVHAVSKWCFAEATYQNHRP
eukprot:3195950-Prymnesium_polylepis.1